MRRIPTALLSLFLIAAAGSARADVLGSEVQFLKLTETVMAKVGQGDLDGAFAAMKPYVVIPAAEFDAITATTRAQRAKAGTRFGKSVGWECLDHEKAGESVARVICYEKTEKHALPWLFYFYKTPRGWVLNSFTWNDNLPSLFAH